MDRPRQDPVSCESCRKRKQKCSREQPCSNCTNRGVPCVFFGRKVGVTTASNSSIPPDAGDLRAENAAIKARLDRLEEIVFNHSLGSDGGASEPPSKVRRIAPPKSIILTPSSTASSQSDPELARKYRHDVEWLDAVGTSNLVAVG